MLHITVQTQTDLVANLTNPTPIMMRALQAKITALTLEMERRIKAEKLSGQVLKVRTGALRRSINHRVDATGTSVTGKVFSNGDVRYARIHEYGGQTKPHDIVPTKASVLAFSMGGKKVFAKRVHHPGSKMPARSYMRSTLMEMRQQILDGMEKAVIKAMKG